MKLKTILCLLALAGLAISVGADEVEDLISALGSEDESVRKYAAEDLIDFADPRSVDPLIAALKDDYWGVRSNAAFALGEIRDTRAVEPLIEALNDEDYLVRGSAAFALGEIGDPRAVDPLIDAFEDEQHPVIRAADAAALDKIIGVAECQWDSYTPDQTAFVGQPGGVFPLRNSPFEAGNYLVLVGRQRVIMVWTYHQPLGIHLDLTS